MFLVFTSRVFPVITSNGAAFPSLRFTLRLPLPPNNIVPAPNFGVPSIITLLFITDPLWLYPP